MNLSFLRKPEHGPLTYQLPGELSIPKKAAALGGLIGVKLINSSVEVLDFLGGEDAGEILQKSDRRTAKMSNHVLHFLNIHPDLPKRLP